MTTMKTEYLISIDNTENICKDEKSFANLLMINNNIKVTRNSIIYKKQNYAYTSKKYLNKKSDFIYFHITIGADISLSETYTNHLNLEQIKSYENLFRDIRTGIAKVAFKIQPIWDDLSFYYSKLTYPLI